MRSRLPSWILLIYLAIDLANPFVPGAFHFTPEQGLVWVEGASHSREGAVPRSLDAREAAPPLRGPGFDGGLLVSGEPAQAWYLTSWLVSVRTGDPPARDFPPPDSDDH